MSMVKFSHQYSRASKAFVSDTTKDMCFYLEIGLLTILAVNLNTFQNSFDSKVIFVATNLALDEIS
jgi:hypothetical protein